MTDPNDLERRFLEAVERGEELFHAAATKHVERSFAEEVVAGLEATPRTLPTRFLYDAEGSRLFEEITRLPEYYPTRTEAAILEEHAIDVAARVGDVTLVELGSGYSVKTAHLLRAFDDGGARYVPVDVSEVALRAAHASIERDFPRVRFSGLVGSFDDAARILPALTPKLVFFLGSTIGNLDEAETEAFYASVVAGMAPGDHFLLGVDLVKDARVLHDAYNDAAGVTAQFTKNLFVRMNRELGTAFDLDAIEHEAVWNPATERIETWAHFHAAHEVALEGRTFRIGEGERLLVEISRKYRIDALVDELAGHGLAPVETYLDEREWFALLLLRRA